jgi:CheY-like chemotaxis protein
MRQVLINLVGNAIKFTEQGSVRVVVRMLDRGGEPAQIVFEVTDTGAGIHPDHQSLVFEPFSQVDETSTRRAGGAGLGLAISRKLARLLGGDVELASALGAGSRFTLRVDVGELTGVPCVDLSHVERRPGRARARADGASAPGRLAARVLLVEDVKINQMLIATYLRKAGAEVVVADNGAEGCELAARARDGGKPFDLLLLDMQMPVMDGYAAARRLRNEGIGCPIVALTAHAMKGDREQCLAAGCSEYTTKPLERVAFIELCKRMVSAEEPKAPLPAPRAAGAQGENVPQERSILALPTFVWVTQLGGPWAGIAARLERPHGTSTRRVSRIPVAPAVSVGLRPSPCEADADGDGAKGMPPCSARVRG